MKRFTFLMMFLLVAGVAVQAQTEDKAAKKEAVEGPMMKFESEVVDYGEVLQDSDPYRVFKFTNVGTEPLIIHNAKGSCGCTVPTVPQDPVLPGETAEIKVRYDTKRVGPFTKTVTLTTNEKSPTRILRITGTVTKPSPEPAGLPVKKGSSVINNKNNN